MANNKFSFLKSVKQDESVPVESLESDSLPDENTQEVLPTPEPQNIAQVTKTPLDTVPPQPRKLGRPKGKRSDPDYEQVTTYIKKETHLAVKMLLLKSAENKDFSELVQNLLEEHLKTQNSESSSF